MHASDGFAAYKGVKRKHDSEQYPDPQSRVALKHRLDKEHRQSGNA